MSLYLIRAKDLNVPDSLSVHKQHWETMTLYQATVKIPIDSEELSKGSIRYCSHICDKIPNKSNLSKQGFIWDQSLRVQFVVTERAGHSASAVRK